MKKILLFAMSIITLGGCNKSNLLEKETPTLTYSYKNNFINPDPFPHCENIPTFSRPLEQAEKWFYGGYFPKLDVDKARVTSISTQCYNCVAWTLGITDAWIWPDGGHVLPTPESTRLEFFNEFYENLGYTITTNPEEAHIEAWGVQPPVGELYMTHASVKYTTVSSTISDTITASDTTTISDTTTWESKLGKMVRMTHGMNELESDLYGKVVVYYKKTNNAIDIEQLRKGLTTPRMKLTEDQYQKFNNKILSIDRKVIKVFDENYMKWKRTWNNDKLRLSSNPSDRASGIDFKNLLEMGDSILPLIVQQLFLFPEDFFALQLYDRLQKNPELKISYKGPKDLKILEGEQNRANRTVRLYIENL